METSGATADLGGKHNDGKQHDNATLIMEKNNYRKKQVQRLICSLIFSDRLRKNIKLFFYKYVGDCTIRNLRCLFVIFL